MSTRFWRNYSGRLPVLLCEKALIVRATIVVWLIVTMAPLAALEPIPDKLVVFTFDDSVASHHSVVRPLLRKYGFGATFFITEGFSFRTNKQDYMTWEQIVELHRDGFEIGNHTVSHMGVTADTLGRLTQEVEGINARCLEHGIPRPVSFAYPGNAITPKGIPLLKQLGFQWARRGGEPEFPYKEGRGVAFEPGGDHPLLLPTAGDARPDWTLDHFKKAVQQARGGRIAILQFHGVPDRDHPWVHTAPERFEQYLGYLAANSYRVIALRDLARFVDPNVVPEDAMAVVERRKASPQVTVQVRGEILDLADGKLIPSRLYIESDQGVWQFPDSASELGSSVIYQRRHGQGRSIEQHTTLSAHPFELSLSPGRYRFIAERGKEYLSTTNEIQVGVEPLEVKIGMRRWIRMASRHWYSGDTHHHRDVREIPNVILAEDLNVSSPMVQWTTVSGISPAQSSKSLTNDFGSQAIEVDPLHVWYPRNSEYEIFTTAGRGHTLGAMVVLNHKSPLELAVPPLVPAAAEARKQGALIDFEKHNWAWSCMLAPLIQPDLYELGNNHHWRVDYAVRSWAIPAPAWMNVEGTGTDTERGWTLYGFRMYYALLNSGFRISPTAGTANGVHPVPMGYSRVYVRLREGFRYDRWMRGLKQGRSFVTTGPMLLATVEGADPGEVFRRNSEKPARFRVGGALYSETSQVTVEVIANGEIVSTEVPLMKPRDSGGYIGYFDADVLAETGGWIAVRCFEVRDGGRLKFAHTAPWWIEMKDKPQTPKREEVAWFVQRTEEELARNRPVLSGQALEEYELALRRWREIEARAR